jgi:hypothetical protein
MEEDIINFLKRRDFDYITINNEKSIAKIYDLLINDIIFRPINSIENHYLAWYYSIIKGDYILMKKHYLIAIQNGNSNSMHYLGNYYNFIEKNYKLMEKYHLMATEYGNVKSIENLLNYYDINDLYIEKLEYLIKYSDKIERVKIINTINQMIKFKLNTVDFQKFVNIVTNFKFEEDDIVYCYVKLLIKKNI